MMHSDMGALAQPLHVCVTPFKLIAGLGSQMRKHQRNSDLITRMSSTDGDGHQRDFQQAHYLGLYRDGAFLSKRLRLGEPKARGEKR